MFVHNLYELPIGVLAIENSGPLVVAVLLLVAYLVAPTSMVVLGLIAAWAALNLMVGGILTVLPLPFLPFQPEQSLSHYLVHVVYSLGQLPLMAVAAGGIHAVRTGDGRID